MRRISLSRWLCLSGVVSAVFYQLHVGLGSRAYPSYDWLRQAVSDLTAFSAPSYAVASRLTTVYGLFSCLCAAIICVVLGRGLNKALRLGIALFAVMTWLSGLGYALFPLSAPGYGGEFQDIMHAYVVTGGVAGLSVISMVLIIAGGLRKKSGLRSLAVCACAALLLMMAGGIGMGAFPAYFGLFERFNVYSAVIFNAVLGVYGFLGKLSSQEEGKFEKQHIL